MKNAFRLLALAALATVFALPAYAQDAAATPAAGPCTTEAEAKAAIYQKFLASYKGSPEQQKAASETGKEYLGKYGTCPDEADKKIATFIQNWVNKYGAASADFAFTKAVNENPAQAFQLSRAALEKNPDNLKIYLQLVAAGLKSAQSGNKNLNADAANAARKALSLLEQGKTSDVWLPFTSQQEATPGLNYYLGFFTLENSPAEAAKYLVKAAQSTSSFAKEPTTYDFLSAAYINSELKTLAAEYKAKYEGKEETPESAALFNKIYAVLDRIIDSYARSVALTPASAAQTDRRNKLATFYKQRHDGQETGLNELIAGILSKPIMLPGQEPAPVASPASSSGANGTASTTTQPAAAKPASTGTTPAAKPASTGTTPAAKPASTGTAPAAKPATTTTPKPPRS